MDQKKSISIEEQKQIQLEILKDVKKICDKYNLNYSLGGGTLLGAIRHKGYIPWDDDIDIMMMRKDYEKLLEIFNENCDKNHKLLCYKNTKDYYYPFAKIVDTRTKLEETNLRTIEDMGIFIDVFPIDFLPNDKNKIKHIFKSYAIWYGFVSVYQSKPEKLTAKSKLKLLIKKMILPILEKFKLYSKILKKIDKIISKYDNTQKVACITGRYQEKEIMPSGYIKEYILVDFEDDKYKIAVGYDEYLKKHYGNYMQLPPEDKRVKEHDNLAYWKCMANQYIYVKYGNNETNLNLYLFSDFLKLKNVEGVQIEKKKIDNIFLKALRKIHLSHKIEKIIKLPMKWIWYDLSQIHIKPNEQYYMIIPVGFFWNGDMSIIKKYKKMKNVKTVLIILDTIGVNTPAGKLIDGIYKDKKWDYICSYDKNDCEKYNFVYIGEHYYSEQNIETNKPINNDAYFMGGLKPGRANMAIELFEYLQKNGVNVKFDIVKNNNTLDFNKKGFNILEKRKPYSYVLNEIQSTNCIIEFLQNGQNTQTLRYFEAVCFNKKLLTNNQNVKNLSFYDERYMKVFEKLEDIDIEWMKKVEKIDYKYNNEFSPNYIIEKLEQLSKNDKQLQ